MNKILLAKLLLISAGVVMLFVANEWKNEDTSLDIILAAIGGFFIGGAFVLKQK